MSSPNLIGKILPNGKYVAIYCHYGANDKEHEENILTWNTDAKVDKLLDYGNISSIEIYPMVANKDTYDSRYGEWDDKTHEWIHPYLHDVRKPRRVHGDDPVFKETFNNIDEAKKQWGYYQLYAFRNGTWFKFDDNFKNLKPFISTMKAHKTPSPQSKKPFASLEHAYRRML